MSWQLGKNICRFSSTAATAGANTSLKMVLSPGQNSWLNRYSDVALSISSLWALRKRTSYWKRSPAASAWCVMRGGALSRSRMTADRAVDGHRIQSKPRVVPGARHNAPPRLNTEPRLLDAPLGALTPCSSSPADHKRTV